MPNTLTTIAPTLFSAAQDVANEPFGAVSAINANFDDKGVAIGDKVKIPVAPTRSPSDYTPGMTTSAGADAASAVVEVAITANKQVSWNLTGEQMLSLQNGGNDQEWARQLVAQGMRALRNMAEADLCKTINANASRAVATSDFSTNIDPLVELRRILQDNGAPLSDLHFVANSSVGASLRKLGIIQQAYQAGSEEERRSGLLLRQFGFDITESAGIVSHTAGTGASYVTDGANAKGVTGINVKTGTGTVLAGDVVSIADTDGKYVVQSGITAPGTFAIGNPGLTAAAADAKAVSIQADYTPSFAFERNAVVGILRPPRIPASPLIQQLPISDDRGMTYLLCQIVGDGMVTWRLHLAWGFQVVQPEFVAIGIG